MLYLILKKNCNYKYSYNVVVMNEKRLILKKIGIFAFNAKLGLFVLTIDMMLLFTLYKQGVFISPKVYKILYMYINRFIL